MSTVPRVDPAEEDASRASEAIETDARLTLESVWGLSQQQAPAGARRRSTRAVPGRAHATAEHTGAAEAAQKVVFFAAGSTVNASPQRTAHAAQAAQAAQAACQALAPRCEAVSVRLDDAAGLATALSVHAPRLVVIDALLCEMLGLTTLRKARSSFPEIDWLLLWEQASPRWLPFLIATQACGAVALMDVGPDVGVDARADAAADANAPLARAVGAVLDGQLWFSRTVLQWMHAE
jgi:DNA-binding NarL/FixJ family response regulator